MKTSRKFLLYLLTAIFASVLLPYRILAQGDRIDLSLWLANGYYGQKVTPSKDNKLFLEVRNTGKTTITNIRLSADKAEAKAWLVEFNPAEIGSLSPGSVQTVELRVTPDSKAHRGDYKITLIAEATEIRKVDSVWFTVESSPFWIKMGAIAAFIVAAVFIVIFLKFGRQQKEGA